MLPGDVMSSNDEDRPYRSTKGNASMRVNENIYQDEMKEKKMTERTRVTVG